MSKQRRHCYTITFKLDVINYAKEHGNRAAERMFGPPPTEKMIRSWRQQEEKLKTVSGSKHNLRGRHAKWPELEDELCSWVTDQRSQGITVSTKMIIFQAKQIAAEQNHEDFTGHATWCFRFMKRKNLVMRTRTKLAQKMPNEFEDKIIEFHRFIINQRKSTNFELSQIANMDETPLTFDVPCNKTVDLKGTKSITVKTSGHEKTHYTVVLTCCADGTKLPPMLIFKRKTMPKDKLPSGVYVHVHPKGWMDENGMRLWLEKVWGRRPGALLKKPALMVWDAFRAHTTDAIKKQISQMKTQVAVIPGGLTSQLQPLDVSINKPFKCFIREEWNKWMQEEECEVTPTGRRKRPSIGMVCEWVKKAWDQINTEIVIKSFKKCGISNALDGTEDDILFEESGESSQSELRFFWF